MCFFTQVGEVTDILGEDVKWMAKLLLDTLNRPSRITVYAKSNGIDKKSSRRKDRGKFFACNIAKFCTDETVIVKYEDNKKQLTHYSDLWLTFDDHE